MLFLTLILAILQVSAPYQRLPCLACHVPFLPQSPASDVHASHGVLHCTACEAGAGDWGAAGIWHARHSKLSMVSRSTDGCYWDLAVTL